MVKIDPPGSETEVAAQLAATDKELRLPRFHALDEPGVSFPRACIDGRIRFGEPGWPYTATHTAPFAHADGSIAREIDAKLSAINGRRVPITVDGRPVEVVIDATPTHAELPRSRPVDPRDPQPEWTPSPVRPATAVVDQPSGGGRAR